MNLMGQSRRQQLPRLRHHAGSIDSHAMFNLLTDAPLLDHVEQLLPPHRERLFPPTETLALFLAQALSSDGSCQQVIDQAMVKRVMVGLSAGKTNTGAYCKARHRLPLEMIASLTRQSGACLTEGIESGWRWRGRLVRVVDGTTVTLADTPENQACFPQSGSQKAGLGFPLCRVVGLFCLQSGALLNAATGPCKGKGSDEQTLLRSLLDSLERDELLLGDAFYATYFLLCELVRRGIDGVFEQLGARKRRTDFREGVQLGSDDHLIELYKPTTRPDWMCPEEYEQAPARLTVREFKAGGKIMVTTLLCHKQVSKQELKQVYRSRWHVELDFRCLKTTLGMEHLRCKGPVMAMKELWVYLLAYNLIRMLMLQSALLADLMPRQLSFKHSVQIWLAWQHYGGSTLDESGMMALLLLVAEQEVGKRPGRVEPRALKRRGKPYPLLTMKRALARAQILKNGHPKKQR